MPDSENKQWFEKDGASNRNARPNGNRPNGKKNKNKPNANRANMNRPNGKPVNNKPGANNAMPARNAGRNNPNIAKNDPSLRNKPTGKKSSENKKLNSVEFSNNANKVQYNSSNAKRPVPAAASNKSSVANKKVVSKKPVKKSFGFKKNNPNKKVAPVKPEVNNVVSKSEVKPAGFDKKKFDNERKKRSRKSVMNKALIALSVCLLFVVLLVFVIHHLFDYIAAKPELTFISNGSVEHTIGARALIVRDEVLVPTDTTGDLVTQATEGSRVYKNQRIGMVVPDNMQTVVDSLRNTQSQISDVQQELIQTGLAEGADNIYEDFNNGLNPIIDLIRLDAMDGKISDMSSYSSSIAVLLNQRETTLAELNFDDERLRVLRSDEAAYENQLSRNASTIRATSPGVISFRMDGMESELNFNVLLEASTATLYDFVNDGVGVIPTDLSVESGDYVARIASNERQYIACFLDEKTATVDSFAIGTRHTINIGSEGISIGKCVVERVEPTEHGLLVVFSTTRYVEDLLDLRTVDIEVVINETQGLRVPITSLVNPDFDRNIATIYVNNQGFCDEVSVIIEDYDREFAIIAPIGDGSVPNLQTVIVTNPSSIKPGEKVDN